MSILCRLGWHAWGPWLDGWIVAIDRRGWGSLRYLRMCSRCGQCQGRDARP